MTPAEESRVLQIALLDAHRYGKPGDADKIIAYVKANPDAVKELAAEQLKAKSSPAKSLESL